VRPGEQEGQQFGPPLRSHLSRNWTFSDRRTTLPKRGRWR